MNIGQHNQGGPRYSARNMVFLVDGKPTLDPNAMGKFRVERNEQVSLIAVS